MSTDHDVVVTGIGATTPIGGTAPETWQAMLDGTIGVKPLTEPWADKYELPVRIYAPLAVDPTDVLPRVEARRLDRCQQVALIAAREAWADAGAPELDPERLGVVVGTGIGGALTLLGQDDILEQQGVRKVAVLTVPMLMPNGPAAAVGLWAKARGGVHAPVSACASGAEAIAWAFRMIKSGETRHRHRRRRGGLCAPAADGRLRPDAGDEHPQRRPAGRLPTVRHRTGRLRPGRGRRDHGAGAGRPRQGPRREDLRPAGRHRDVERRVPHHRPRAGGRGFGTGDRQGAASRPI